MKELRVVGVQVKDVLGAREFNMEPGKITVLAGRNGSGKSTALQAVQAALGGGNLARLARVDLDVEEGEIEPEVVLVIEGEGSESYRVERRGDKVRVRARVGDTAAFEDVGKPQSWLRSLYDPAGANPVRFLMADDKDRALMLLEALPLRMNRAELLLQMGIRADELRPIPDRLHPLEELSQIRDQVFTMRTGVNRDAKGKKAAADQTRRNAPAVVPDDPGGQAQAEAEVACIDLAQAVTRDEEKVRAAEEAANQAARAAYEQAEADVTGTFKAEAAKLRTEHERVIAEMRAEVERQIAARTAQLEATIGEMRTKGETTLTAAEETRSATVAAAAQVREAARAALDARKQELAEKRQALAVLREKREMSASARALHTQAKQFDDEAGKLELESTRMTDALAALDVYRRKLGENIPIDGLTIDGPEIRVDGVLFEQLNAAQRVAIAVRVACLRAKDARLPVVFVDDGEKLDREHFELLCDELAKAGVQAFVGRVEDHDLVVSDAAAVETRA